MLAVTLLGGFAAFAATVLLRSEPGTSLAFDAGLYNVPFAAAALLCLAGNGPRRAGWRVLGLGLALFGIANAFSTIAYAGSDDPPYPSPADVGWIAFYPIAYLSLLKLGRTVAGRRSRADELDGLIAALGAGALVGALALGPILDATSGSFPVVATNLAYPTGDGLLLMLVVGMIATGRIALDRTSILIASGFVSFALADGVFLFEEAAGTYVEGGLLDLGWAFAAVLLGIAALADRRPAPTTVPRQSRRSLAGAIWLPAFAAVAAIAVLASQAVTTVAAPALIAAIACLLLGVVRIVTAFRDLRGLAEARLEARTDELTGLANRRAAYEQVERRVAPAGTGQPFGLAIIDLDGFKVVNDALGHLVGDQLLAAFGERLHTSTTCDGVAYRLSGDEFAIVVDGGADVLEGVVAGLRGALSTPIAVHGRHILVSASVGTARFPDDGATVDRLMRVADQAMYRDKRSRTRSGGNGAAQSVGR